MDVIESTETDIETNAETKIETKNETKNESETKKGIFTGIKGFIKSIGRGRSGGEPSMFLRHIAPYKSDARYDSFLEAAKLCESAQKIARDRLYYLSGLRKLDASLSELECYNSLSDDDTGALKTLLDRYASLMRDRKTLQNQLSGFEKPMSYLRDIVTDADAAIPHIQDAEEKQRNFRHDLAYLEAENQMIDQERQTLTAAQKFIHAFSMIMAFALAGAILILGYFNYFHGMDVRMPAFLMLSGAAALYMVLYLVRWRISRILANNVKRQQKAAELINKKTVVYAHYTNFLNYEYAKYRVRNSDMLKDTLSEYSAYKHISARLDSIRNIMYQTENDIQKFLADKNMTDLMQTLESFAQGVDVEDKRDYYREVAAERSGIEAKLSKLDAEHEQVWDKLMAFQQNDGLAPIADELIEICIDDTGRMIMEVAY